MATKTLLETALASPIKSRARRETDYEHAELAVAFLTDKIKASQVAAAVGEVNARNAQNWALTILRRAAAQGLVKFSLNGNPK